MVPSTWFASKAPEKLMVISLGAGAVGPDPTGLTAMGGKKVEEVAPPTKRPEPVLPTVAKSTAMTEPVKTPAKTPPPKNTTSPSPQTAAPPKPSTGAQITPGNAATATTATGLGVGLSTGGQGGSSLDSNWCCPDWTNQMRANIHWNENQGLTGEVVIEFVVDRSGKIISTQMKKQSGYPQLDLDAQRALSYAQLPPLPEAYVPNRLTITLTFPYIR